jgi:ubiquinone/menaquinone biosynthesis C-methylase UbiE
MEDGGSSAEEQQRVDGFFATRVATWAEIYGAAGLVPVIHQERRAVSLRWIDELTLAPGARVLEVGCGAGLTAVSLAQRGYVVDAVDTVPEMLERTRQAAADAGVGDRVTTSVEDAHQLMFPDGTFRVVLALGVLPWLHTPRRALSELARVAQPDGYVLVSAHNRWRLIDVLEPWVSPPLSPIRRVVGGVVRRLRLWRRASYPEPVPQRVSAGELDRWLEVAGLRRVRSMTLGFGPFTVLDRQLFAEATGVRLHRVMQRLADRSVPVLRSSGAQHLVLAHKLRPDQRAV